MTAVHKDQAIALPRTPPAPNYFYAAKSDCHSPLLPPSKRSRAGEWEWR